MDNEQLATTFEAGLHLERRPVGLAFLDGPPPGVPSVSDVAPSACTFWRRAEQGVFYAAAADHYECGVGAMTMGFELPEAEQGRAMELVGTMVDLGYFSMDEVPHLPSVQKPHRGILYGPLAELPVEPDVVLVIASPYQAMLIVEAGGSATLGDAPGLGTMGRPACSAIPQAFGQGAATLSLGCIGARTYAEVPHDRVVLVIPNDKLKLTAAQLDASIRANATLDRYHAQKKARFPEPMTLSS